jgi:hypothetical protein
MIYHGLAWTMDYHGLFWIIVDYYGLCEFSRNMLDDELSWPIMGYRGSSRTIVNYPDYGGLLIIMVHMIFVENCLPFLSYIWKPFF